MSYTDADMYEAWSAGAQWVAERVEIVDDELFIPADDPGVLGRDWREACADWLNDFDMERAALDIEVQPDQEFEADALAWWRSQQ